VVTRERRLSGEVVDVEDETGRALQVQQPRARQRRIERLEIAPVDEVDLDREPRQKLAQQPVGIGVDVAHADDALSGGDVGEDCRADGGHPARKCPRRFAALERRDLVLK
jgi:hypothetical protein